MEFEKIREKKRFFEGLFEAEMAKQEVELSHMIEEHGKLSGHQSEPTTPPEYRESTTGFPSMLSRPNRYSLSSLMSPQGMASRTSRSGSVLASPQSGIPMSRFAFDDQVPAWSQQTSRRNSDEDEKEEAVRQDPTSHRSTNAYVNSFVAVCCWRVCSRACKEARYRPRTPSIRLQVRWHLDFLRECMCSCAVLGMGYLSMLGLFSSSFA